MLSDYIGQKRGKLWAIGFNQMRNDPNFIMVFCECGYYNEIDIETFLNESFKCACYPMKPKKDTSKEDVIGKTYSNWKIESFTEKRKSMAYYECVCECGEKKVFALSNLRQGRVAACKCTRNKVEKEVNLNEGRKPGRPKKQPEPDIKPYLDWCKNQFNVWYLRSQGLPSSIEEMRAAGIALIGPPEDAASLRAELEAFDVPEDGSWTPNS